MGEIDIGRDAAHDAAQNELAKAIYPKPSLSEQIMRWIEDLLYRVVARGAELPGGWFTVAVLVVLLLVAVIVAVRIARRAMRTSRAGPVTLFDDQELSAAEHRATAERHAAAAEWAPAIRHRVRAVARQLEENGVLDPGPGRTATELARVAGRVLPGLADDLTLAAEAFNDVTYGERPGSQDQYAMIAVLDGRLGDRTASASGDRTESAPQSWAEVR
ncbi:MAG: DUF4129 domain-containing protein [Actinomycetota bacterium]|nr:DUF4129 domain-containing protein [Actinomycetota bacterium]